VEKTVEIKIADDIEYRVIGNVFGLLIASAGLLAGEMIRLRSFDYWLMDIVPLVLMSWTMFRLYRNFLSTLTAYQDVDTPAGITQNRIIREVLKSEKGAVGQIAAKTGYDAEQVVAEVVKRIDAQKAKSRQAK
jgi:hypothetical protein